VAAKGLLGLGTTVNQADPRPEPLPGGSTRRPLGQVLTVGGGGDRGARIERVPTLRLVHRQVRPTPGSHTEGGEAWARQRPGGTLGDDDSSRSRTRDASHSPSVAAAVPSGAGPDALVRRRSPERGRAERAPRVVHPGDAPTPVTRAGRTEDRGRDALEREVRS
jgi:hypothetical protein